MRASRAEIKIQEILEMNNIPFEMEYTFPDLRTSKGIPLRFDFALFGDDGKLQSLIEYQGRQHYEAVSKFGGYKGYYQQKHNDDMKRRYCFLHNIPLIEIPYTDENKISYDYIIQKTGY